MAVFRERHRPNGRGRRILMMEVSRRIIRVGLAILLIAGIYGICGVSWARPDGEQNEPEIDMEPQCGPGMAGPCPMMMQPRNEGFPMGVPLGVLHSGHGFALKDNESHILRLKVEAIMPMQPGQVRDILSSNKSLEEIRDDIRARAEEADGRALRGSMILDRMIYPLIDIATSSYENNSTSLKADLAGVSQPPSNNSDSIGSLYVLISPSDGGMIGNGDLNIREGQGEGKYSILLDMEPPRKRQERGEERMDS